MAYPGRLMEKPGEYVTTIAEYKEQCGVQMPVKSKTTFAGKPYMNEEVTEVTCGAPDAKLFEKPQQVADGTLEEKTSQPMTLACLKHKGPYTNMAESFGKLMNLLQKQKLKYKKNDEKKKYLAICGYNWGPGSINRKIIGKNDVENLDAGELREIIKQKAPKETSDYLERVLKREKIYEKMFD